MMGLGSAEGGRDDHPRGMGGAGGLGSAEGASSRPQVLDDPPPETIDGDAGGQRQLDGASSAAVLGAHVEEGPRVPGGEQHGEEEEEPMGVGGGGSSEVELLGEELTCELRAGLAAMEVSNATAGNCRELPGASFRCRDCRLASAAAPVLLPGPAVASGSGAHHLIPDSSAMTPGS